MATPPSSSNDASDLATVARRLGLIFLLCALGLSLYLGIQSVTSGAIAGCADGGGCHSVVSSKWGYLLGLPVSFLGALTYLALMGSELKGCCASIHALCRWLILGAALWFVCVQVFILGEFCPWCCLTHTLAVLGALCLWRRSVRTDTEHLAGHRHLAPVLGLLALAGLIAVQTFGPERPTTAGGSLASGQGANVSAPTNQGPRILSLHGGEFQIDVAEFPSIGNAQTATHVAAGLFDFTCPHCQKLTHSLTQIQEVFGDRLAIVQLPGHFNTKGESLQKMLLPIWKEDPESYTELAHLLHEGTLRAVESEVRVAIGSFVEPEVHAEWMRKHASWSDESLSNSQAIREANRKLINTGKFPQLMIGDYVEAGNKDDLGHYYQLFQEHFGLTRTDLPQLSVEPSSLSLGEIYVGAAAKFSLKLKNPGGPTVHLGNPTLVRGMRLLRFPKKELAAGEEMTIDIEARPPVPGDIKGSIILRSDAEVPSIHIPVEAKATAVYTATPSFANLGTYAGRPLTGKINLSFAAPANIGTPRPSNQKEFRVTVQEVEPNLRYQLNIVATPNVNRVGQHNTTIQIPVKPVDENASWPTLIRVAARCKVNPPPAAIPAPTGSQPSATPVKEPVRPPELPAVPKPSAPPALPGPGS